MVSWNSKKPRKITISQGYGVVAFPEAATDKNASQGNGVFVFPEAEKENNAFLEATKGKYQLGLWSFPDAAKENFQLGLGCCGFSRNRETEMLFKVKLSWLSQRPRKRNFS